MPKKKRFSVHRLPVEDADATDRQLNELVSEDDAIVFSGLVTHVHGSALLIVVEHKAPEAEPEAAVAGV